MTSDEQHHPGLVRVVPDLVVEGVVEDHRLALFPVAVVVADTDPAGLRILGDDQAKVIAEHAPCRAHGGRGCALRGERIEIIAVFMPGISRISWAVRGHISTPSLALEAVAVEEERLPAVVVGDLDLVLGDVLEVRPAGRAGRRAVPAPSSRITSQVGPRCARPRGSARAGRRWRRQHQRALADEALDKARGSLLPTLIVSSTTRSHSDFCSISAPPSLACASRRAY